MILIWFTSTVDPIMQISTSLSWEVFINILILYIYRVDA